MHEKELRLALVCYGGVSLAIYMSGVTKEVLKVVRASRTWHSLIDPQEQLTLSYDDVADTAAYETDTERLYFELFQSMAPELELRVVVDIISGASAGGINGILLARALAHDLSTDNHRKMWLERADVTRLMEPDTIADKWSKFYLYPFFWAMNSRRLRTMVPNDETRSKLSIFVRSRWFKPPFSGKRMLDFMLDAADDMDRGENPDTAKSGKTRRSLIPRGLRLDLFVSLTNFHGRHQKIMLHDPKEIIEREHRTNLTFSYLHRESGIDASDFDDDNVPGLAFAARSTSSFPGAFPPAQLSDLDTALARRKRTWPARHGFMMRNFPAFAIEKKGDTPKKQTNNLDPKRFSFIDGAVVNNKPFAAAIEALAGRPAQREVDRRIVYIDPVPEDLSLEEQGTSPGFFRTILSSLSEIPRNEPINDELNWVNRHNRDSRRLQSIMSSVKGDVNEIIDEHIKQTDKGRTSVALIASWRDQVNVEAKERAGYGYTSYSHTKTYAVLDRLAELICDLCARHNYNIRRRTLNELLHKKGYADQILWDADLDNDAIADHTPVPVDMQVLIQFLRDFDVDFRIRRLQFVISSLNEIYQSKTARTAKTFDPHLLNTMKQEIYTYIGELKENWHLEVYLEKASPQILALGDTLEQVSATSVPDAALTTACEDALSVLLERIASLMELEDLDLTHDQTMSDHIGSIEDPRIRQELFRAYIGFPFFDVLTLPLLQTMDMSEIDPIRVDRISPEDCPAIRKGGAREILKGTGFARFAAFFSRADRENDYLWGRLNSAERLTDFIVSSAQHSNVEPRLDTLDFKKRLFLSILDAERPHLQVSKKLLSDLEVEIKAIC